MDPARKRTVRLVVALTAAVLLAGALAWTSFSASSEATHARPAAPTPSPARRYQLTGRVAEGSYERSGNVHTFRVRERDRQRRRVPVRYEGSVPDPFREGREVIVTVQQGRRRHVRGREGLAHHEVPVEVHRRTRRRLGLR